MARDNALERFKEGDFESEKIKVFVEDKIDEEDEDEEDEEEESEEEQTENPEPKRKGLLSGMFR